MQMNEEQNNFKKIHMCKYAHIELGEYCYKCKYANSMSNITEKDCEGCLNYKSRYIEYPITVKKIENHFEYDNFSKRNCGKLVKVRPCVEKDSGEEKTYLGIYLGEFIIGCGTSYSEKTQIVSNTGMMNPAIFVPELSKVVFGCESWWGFIDSEEDLSDITDDMIENQWYVQLLKSRLGKE